MDMGNFSFPNMNFPNLNLFGHPNHHTSSSDDSDSDITYSAEEDSESSESSFSDEESHKSCNDDTFDSPYDSVLKTSKKKYHSCYEITLEEINDIEKELDLYEVISLIFLLFDDIHFAIQVVRSLIAAGLENFTRGNLFDWARTSKKWKYKLFEALAIIQNNKILMKRGLSKEDINIMRDAPVYVNRLKKILFSLCEFLKIEQAKELIFRVRRDARFVDDITVTCDPSYLEFHILFWLSRGYISIEREPYLENLIKHMKDKSFLNVSEKITEEITTWRKGTFKSSNEYKVKHEHKTDEDEECYEFFDPNKPGLVVIINNSAFKRNFERRKEFKLLCPEQPLDDRHGSEKDVMKLEKVFTSLKYDVIVRNDIPHDQLVDEIHKTIMSNFQVGRHSVMVLCVLSHGDKGVVYGVNSIPIKKKEIVNSISGMSRLIGLLADIPKVIIMQACEGTKVLCADPEPDLLVPDCVGPVVADCDSSKFDFLDSNNPRDRVVCIATVKGFAALRSLVNGSPYIQELCRCIKKYHSNKHFIDIMTIVHSKLNQEKRLYKQRRVCMIPEIKDNTLCKMLYLSPKH